MPDRSDVINKHGVCTPEAIVRALAAADPRHHIEGTAWQITCGLCSPVARPDSRAAPTTEGHEPDCPWRLAVEWCAAEDTRQANIAAARKLHDDALRHLAASAGVPSWVDEAEAALARAAAGGQDVEAARRDLNAIEAAPNLKHETGGEER